MIISEIIYSQTRMPKMGILTSMLKAGNLLKLNQILWHISISRNIPEHSGSDQSLLGQPVRKECHNQLPRHIQFQESYKLDDRKGMRGVQLLCFWIIGGSLPLLLFSSRNYKNWGEAKIMEKGSSQIVLEISTGTSYRGYSWGFPSNWWRCGCFQVNESV